MAPARDNAASSLAPELLSAGLFVVTALASQWLQHHLKGRERAATRGFAENIDITLEELPTRQRQKVVRQRRRKQQQNQKHHDWHDDEGENNVLSGGGEGYREGGEGDSDEGPMNGDSSDPLLVRDYYKTRRLEGRLSFENLRPLVQEAEKSWSPLKISPLRAPSETQNLQGVFAPPHSSQYATAQQNFQQLQRSTATTPPPTAIQQHQHQHHTPKRKSQKHRNRRPRSASLIDREDEYDFLPKNSNWNHLERYNEDDIKNGVVSPDSAQQPMYHPQNHFPQQEGGYGGNNQYYNDNAPKNYESAQESDTADEDDRGDSSSVSSEEQFVWTDAAHEKRAGQKRPSTTRPLPSQLGGVQAMKEYHQSVAAPTQEGSIEDELPGGVRQSPPRVQRGDSGSTVTTGNDYLRRHSPTNIPDPPTGSGDYQSSHQLPPQRDFLRHASSMNDSSAQEQERPPLRFPPASSINHSVPKKHTFSGSVASGDSDFSGLSSSSHPPQAGISTKGQKRSAIRSHRSARAQYNAKIMPNKVVMVRHGQSMGNINEELYSTTPDNAMPLTKLGWEQARKAGQHLKNNVLAPLESVHFIVSPYVRTVETFHGIVSAWCDPNSPEFASISNREMRLKAWYGRLLEMGLTWHEDPRIREQDFGNYQDPETIRKAKRDRHNFGIFYYRFPHGESASDVFDRVSTFLDSLWRSFDMNRSRNYVLVTHGISIRVLLARYFRYTIHQFNMLANPRNCEMVALGHDGHGRLRLEGRYQLHLKEQNTNGATANATAAGSKNSNGQHASEQSNEEEKEKTRMAAEECIENNATAGTEVDDYRFYKRLRVLPQHAIRKVKFRISYDDTAPA